MTSKKMDDHHEIGEKENGNVMKSMVIIPTYNEKKNIPIVVEKILALNKRLQITIVDDNSPDGTGQIADRLSRKHKDIFVIHREKKRGLGTAYVEGFKYALSKGADLIFEMDADLSHDPSYLVDFLEEIVEADMVIGSRYIHGGGIDSWGFGRRCLSRAANIFVSIMFVHSLNDFTAGFRCYRRKLLETLDLDRIRTDGYAFQIELAYYALKNGFAVKEIPIFFYERKHGESKLSLAVASEALCLTFKLRAPLRKIIRNLGHRLFGITNFMR